LNLAIAGLKTDYMSLVSFIHTGEYTISRENVNKKLLLIFNLIFLNGFDRVLAMKYSKGVAVFPNQCEPLNMARYFDMPEEFYDWQAELLTEVAKPKSRVAVSTCNESGKTSLIVPLLGLSVMAAFPGSTVVSTAGAEEQIKGQLFNYITSKLRSYTDKGWKVTESELTVHAPEIDGLRSRWIARVPKDALTLEGYHGSWKKGHWCPICFIIDEAKSVDKSIFEAAWRIDPDWFLVISTPGEDAGPFFEAMEDVVKGGDSAGHYKSKDGLWTYRRRISWEMCPHLLTPEKLTIRQALIRKHGENSSFIKSFLGGEFWRDSDENYVFTNRDVDLIRNAMRNDEIPIKHGDIRAALEFSSGGDEQSIGIVNGNEIVCWEQFREQNTANLARLFIERLQKHKVPPWNCNADSGGVGHAIIYNMEDLGYGPINRYMNNQTSIDTKEYADRMTEDHYRFKEKLDKYSQIIRLPNDPVLFKQIRQRKKGQDDHNRVKLELKPKHRSRTGESPDRLDTLIMLYADWEPPPEEKQNNPDENYVSKLEDEARKRGGSDRPFMDMIVQPDLAELDQEAKGAILT
jgi:hypothetical protein